MKSILLVAAFAALALAEGSVVSLNPGNFDQYVGGSKPVLVKFFAPWCGHCKKLAPEYVKAADSFKDGKVVLAEVDCDANGGLCTRFDVKGYPTVKFFPAGQKTGKDFDGERTAEGIIEYLSRETGAKSANKGNVIAVSAADFDKVVLDTNKDVFVKFYAPWCGHCKALAPTYVDFSKAFAAESEVVIAEVNCDAEKDLCGKYDVHSFPTLKFFPKGNKAGTAYTGGRDLQAFIDFMNTNVNTHRTATGLLDGTAGRVSALDAIATQFVASEKKAELIDQAKTAVDALVGAEAKYGKIYLKVMKSISEKGKDFIATETARVQKFIESGQVSLKKVDEFTVRKNILAAF